MKIDMRPLNDKVDGVEQRLSAKIDGADQKLSARIDCVKDLVTALAINMEK